jgi:folate-binding protein YgfZ
MTLADLRAALLANGPFVRAEAPYQRLVVHGPEAGDFVQRLCSQDVLGAADGEVRPAAFLDAKGKLLVTCLVARHDGAYWLETGADQAERLALLLERYHFTEKLGIERRPARGRERIAAATGVGLRSSTADHFVFERRGIRFERDYGPPLAGSAATELDPERAECLRLVAGLVRVGVETEPSTLGLEADLDDHCSTTKGCYTGQEIVARIHTYGHVNRKLCLLQFGPGAPIERPAPLHDADQIAVGRVMHAVPLPGGGGRLGIGFLPRDFQALGTRVVLADGSDALVIGYEPLPA